MAWNKSGNKYYTTLHSVIHIMRKTHDLAEKQHTISQGFQCETIRTLNVGTSLISDRTLINALLASRKWESIRDQSVAVLAVFHVARSNTTQIERSDCGETTFSCPFTNVKWCWNGFGDSSEMRMQLMARKIPLHRHVSLRKSFLKIRAGL